MSVSELDMLRERERRCWYKWQDAIEDRKWSEEALFSCQKHEALQHVKWYEANKAYKALKGDD